MQNMKMQSKGRYLPGPYLYLECQDVSSGKPCSRRHTREQGSSITTSCMSVCSGQGAGGCVFVCSLLRKAKVPITSSFTDGRESLPRYTPAWQAHTVANTYNATRTSISHSACLLETHSCSFTLHHNCLPPRLHLYLLYIYIYIYLYL